MLFIKWLFFFTIYTETWCATQNLSMGFLSLDSPIASHLCLYVIFSRSFCLFLSHLQLIYILLIFLLLFGHLVFWISSFFFKCSFAVFLLSLCSFFFNFILIRLLLPLTVALRLSSFTFSCLFRSVYLNFITYFCFDCIMFTCKY